MTVRPEIDETTLVARLRNGDEAAFTAIVDRYYGAMLRVARGFVHDHTTAEEVVQEAWIGVLNGLGSFAGRSSLRSWIFAIVVNRAKTKAVREARSTPFSALAVEEASGKQTSVDPVRFRRPGMEWPGHWAEPPQPWAENPEARLLQGETMAYIERALEVLPPAQRSVITLRDFAGYDARAVCNALGITETNMRVLLHRARSKIRGQLEQYIAEPIESSGTSS
jgi:RNA polymerase sigma-70 factor (ECF subfamily)